MEEIYNLNRKLERVLDSIKESNVLDSNKNLILEFHDEILAQGLSKFRILFYMEKLLSIARWSAQKSFKDMIEDDIKELVRKIESMDYEEWTKANYKVTIKKFFKWLDGSDKRVTWLKTKMKRCKKKLPDELLDKDDIQKLLKACVNVRDKAIISVLWESGCRIGELLSLLIKNVSFDKYGAIIIIREGKTGSRRIRLISSVPHLANWLEHHPCKNSPDFEESPLWVSIGSKNNSNQIDYHAVRMMLRKVAKRANIKKKVNPHIFRHSRATDLANHLTEAQMKEYFGWVQGSDMASVYVHLAGRDTDEAILRIHGKLPQGQEQIHEQLKVQLCPICHHENPPELEFCINCRRPLSLKASLELERKEQEFLQMITPEIIERMIAAKVEKILSQYNISKEKKD
ncbi:MAG: tyrosine-type recombinase/integrase [Nitrososphaerales archaeon]